MQFKKILKECIKELIDEGAFNKVVKENFQPGAVEPVNSYMNPSRPVANDFAGNQVATPNDPAQAYNFSSMGQGSPNDRLREVARMTALYSTNGDQKQAKVMESIFADTAMTTLQNQMGSEMSGGGNANGMYMGEAATKEDEQMDQAQIQALNGGRPMNHWAALAFGKYGKKNGDL